MSRTDPSAPRDANAPGEVGLEPVAVAFLAQLPEEVRPMRLATKFPRIVNHIARHWHAPQVLKPYFSSVIVDERGDREGFPAPILEELLRLARYHDGALLDQSVDPAADHGGWDTIYYKD